MHLRWNALQAQIGSNDREAFNLAYRIRSVMADAPTAYPQARIDVTPHGLLLKPSAPAVPKTTVPGFRLIEAPPTSARRCSSGRDEEPNN